MNPGTRHHVRNVSARMTDRIVYRKAVQSYAKIHDRWKVLAAEFVMVSNDQIILDLLLVRLYRTYILN